MGNQRRGGLKALQINGEVYDAKGSFTYNLGKDKNESIVGADRIHGHKSTPQPGFAEGEITDRAGLSLEDLVTAKDATVTLSLGNGKMFVLHDAVYVGDGTGNTDEGNIDVRFEGRGEEVTP